MVDRELEDCASVSCAGAPTAPLLEVSTEFVVSPLIDPEAAPVSDSAVPPTLFVAPAEEEMEPLVESVLDVSPTLLVEVDGWGEMPEVELELLLLVELFRSEPEVAGLDSWLVPVTEDEVSDAAPELISLLL